MTVTLTAEQEKFIAEQLAGSHYSSVDDVIAQSLGMLRAGGIHPLECRRVARENRHRHGANPARQSGGWQDGHSKPAGEVASASVWFSLTPGFSRVLHQRQDRNRFNGFIPPAKPLKRFFSSAVPRSPR